MSKLALSLLLGLLKGASDTPSCIDGAVDRFEWADDTKEPTFVVLDAAEYPSINLPGALSKGFKEGDRVEVCAQVRDTDLVVYLVKRK